MRWVDPAGAHLTLKFLGATPEDAVERIGAALARAAGGIGELSLATHVVGGFPNPRAPRVLWLGVAGRLQSLADLRDRVEAEIAPLGWPTEGRAFSPHLTLGRVRREASAADRRAIAAALATAEQPPRVEFIVSELSLMLSELSPKGARYTRLLAAPL